MWAPGHRRAVQAKRPVAAAEPSFNVDDGQAVPDYVEDQSRAAVSLEATRAPPSHSRLPGRRRLTRDSRNRRLTRDSRNRRLTRDSVFQPIFS